MKPEQLKLYNKYKNIDYLDREYIYIGIDNDNYYWFIYKSEDFNLSFSNLNFLGFNPNQIVNDLNLETHNNKFIKGYNWVFYLKKSIEQYLKPILKDKLKNIINR